MSARNGALASLSDSSGALTGQSIARRASFQRMPASAARVVGRGAQVGEHRALAQRHEAVREAFRDPEMALVLGAQHHRSPAPERAASRGGCRPRRPRPRPRAPTRTCPAGWATGNAGRAARRAPSDETLPCTKAGCRPCSRELVVVQGLVEEAALVAEHPRLDHQAARQVGFDHLHGAAFMRRGRARAGPAGTGRSRSWPAAWPASRSCAASIQPL